MQPPACPKEFAGTVQTGLPASSRVTKAHIDFNLWPHLQFLQDPLDFLVFISHHSQPLFGFSAPNFVTTETRAHPHREARATSRALEAYMHPNRGAGCFAGFFFTCIQTLFLFLKIWTNYTFDKLKWLFMIAG